MRKFIYILLLLVITSSCGVSINSVVDKRIEKPYQNTLVVIPYERGSTRNFSNKLKEKLEVVFSENGKSVDFYLFEKENNTLQLNQNSSIEREVSYAVNKYDIDLLLIFKPTKLQFVDGGLQSATYELIGVDTGTNKEIWKANFSSNSSFGPSLFAEKSANTIFEKLKEDKVL